MSFHDPMEFAKNMAQVAEKSRHLVQEFMTTSLSTQRNIHMDPMNVSSAFFDFFTHMMSDPTKVFKAQMDLWEDYMTLWQRTTLRLLGEPAEPVIAPDDKDRRFKDAAWQESVVFDYLKQSYLLIAKWLQEQVQEAEGLDDKTAHKVEFYTRQFVDAMSPSNFLMTNPEVLRTTLETNGENLVKGLEHMLEDLERGKGKLNIRMTDLKAFVPGKNIAATPGKVVFQNDLMQLIQYTPTTEKVYKTPLLLIPAWINKFYILDLKPESSLVKWLVDQGFTVFMVSWVNPNEAHREKSFDDYMVEGPLAAIDAIEQATGEKQVNVAGYCLGGTLLSITVNWLKAKKRDAFKSVTYFTTMVDFGEAGDLSVFIDEEQLKVLENRMSATGYLEGADMATTFNMLRANDLIWSFVVNNYLLGKEPFPFDVLYWNSDSTRLPAKMHSFYLRNMYQKNLLVEPGGLTIGGVKIDLRKNDAPACFISTREDHIAPWKSTYAATQLYSGPIKFILAGSGHVVGIVNPPAKQKYNYWTGTHHPADPDQWLETAKEQPGSWWPEWKKWLEGFSGEQIPARKPGSGKLKVLEDAPGSYVLGRD